MSDPSFAVQSAIYTALRSDATLTGLLAPHKDPAIGGSAVYDKVPAKAAYPYVTLDAQFVTDDDFVASRKDRRFFYLNIWSDKGGQKECWDIMSRIDTILHEQRLPLDTGTMIRCRVKRKRTQREPDNVTFMGQVTLLILTQH